MRAWKRLATCLNCPTRTHDLKDPASNLQMGGSRSDKRVDADSVEGMHSYTCRMDADKATVCCQVESFTVNRLANIHLLGQNPE